MKNGNFMLIYMYLNALGFFLFGVSIVFSSSNSNNWSLLIIPAVWIIIATLIGANRFAEIRKHLNSNALRTT